jgi:hypothetical protein
LAAEEAFTVVTEHVVIHDCIVHVGNTRFLVLGYYKPTLPINQGLKEISPGFNWRGEIIVVALGKRVPYLSKVKAWKAKVVVNQSVHVLYCYCSF